LELVNIQVKRLAFFYRTNRCGKTPPFLSCSPLKPPANSRCRPNLPLFKFTSRIFLLFHYIAQTERTFWRCEYLADRPDRKENASTLLSVDSSHSRQVWADSDSKVFEPLAASRAF